MVTFQSWKCIILWCAIFGPLVSRGLNPTTTSTLQSAEVDQRLRVHIVPHTHDDSGWLKTVTQYYWGDRQEIQSAGVQYILDSVVEALVANPSRRFSYAEMSFFMRWWKLQDEATKKVVKKLVKEGRLDFVNGGYVQHDEAASHYIGMIDQTTRGHRFLNDTFGFVPRIGWQIDPFGHSSTQAGLLGEELGFDAFFFGRADHEDMARRKEEKTLEFLWRGSGGRASCDDGEKGTQGIFVGNFPSGNYGPPAGFDWEFRESSDSPIQDDPDMDGYNVPERVEDFVLRCYEIWNVTRGSDIMLTMGSDFHYSNAHAWFKNLDKLIKYVNEDGRLLAFFSTPAAYVEMKQQTHLSWPEKVDDFFPYSDFEQAFWTGYFTSRPTSKGYIRKLTSFLQAARQLETFLGTAIGGTDALEEAISLCQHHDSITGTEKQHVADDYHLRLHKGLEEAQQTVLKALLQFLKNKSVKYGMHSDEKLKMADNWNADFCNLLNISVCQPTIEASKSDSGVFHLWIYNSLTYERNIPIRIPISLDKHSHWQVLARDGYQIEAQVIPISKATRNVQKNEMGENFIQDDKLTNDLVFMAAVPPLGYSLLDVIPKSDIYINQEKDSILTLGTDTTISNGILTVTFDSSTGMLVSIGREGLPPIDISTTLFWYNSSDGLEAGNVREQSSGAYIFQPNGKYNVVTSHNVKLEIIKGEIVNEARQQFNEWCFLTTRLYKDREYLEVEWTAGPLPDDGHGREVVLTYNTSINSGAEFWTDSNGRAMIRRVRNKRLSWDSKLADSIAGNFYPITSAIYIADKTHVFSVITDRAQGAASLGPGHIEIMLHRRTLVDDKRGVGENLNETFCQGDSCPGLIARGKHLLHLQRTGESAMERRALQQEANDEALVAFLSDALDSDSRFEKYALGHTFSFIESLHFPPEIQILTLQRTSQDRILLRLAHQMDSVEGATPVSVPKDTVNRLMHHMSCQVLSFEELSLSGNQMIHQIERLRFRKGEIIGNLSCSDVFSQPAHSFNVPNSAAAVHVDEQNRLDQNNNIVLQPMQIRTYNVLCNS